MRVRERWGGGGVRAKDGQMQTRWAVSNFLNKNQAEESIWWFYCNVHHGQGVQINCLFNIGPVTIAQHSNYEVKSSFICIVLPTDQLTNGVCEEYMNEPCVEGRKSVEHSKYI